MAFNAADLTAIDAALLKLADGERVTEVRFSDRTVRYESANMNDLLKLRQNILAEAPSAAGRSRQIRLFRSSRGI